MTDIGRMLQKHARTLNIPQWVLEKDYALSYVLSSIARTPGLGDKIVLKGGTALKKAYFPDYRFSEDLDYSAKTADLLESVDWLMGEAIRQTENCLHEKGFFRIQYERLSLREPHPDRQVAFTIRVQFPHHRQPLCRVKVEISVDEPILLPPEKRPIFHGYEESFSDTVEAYTLAEILAEKLRALLQSYTRIQTRGWGASRACRDYYDIWQILNRGGFTATDIRALTEQKCAAKGIQPPEVDDFFQSTLLDVARREWGQMLMPFIPEQPEPDQVFTEIRQAIDLLW